MDDLGHGNIALIGEVEIKRISHENVTLSQVIMVLSNFLALGGTVSSWVCRLPNARASKYIKKMKKI